MAAPTPTATATLDRALKLHLQSPIILAFVFGNATTGFYLGGSMVLGGIAAGASYISTRIAVRLALPKANPGYYLSATLAITLPFNLTLGIPLYYAIAQLFYK